MCRSPASLWTAVVLVLGVALLIPPAWAIDAKQLRELRQQAELAARQGDWEKACDLYETVLRFRRDLPDVKDQYIHCVRRLWQLRRHHDLSYSKEVLSIEYGQAVHLYGVLRDLLLDQSLERKSLTPAKLFRKGLEELDYALADPFFCKQHIPPERLGRVAEFRALVQKTWGGARPATRKDALKQVCEVALAAQNFLRLSATVTVMEFTCGACYAMDEYTVYLTPIQLRELCSSLRGEAVGVGITVGIQDGRVLVQQVDPLGPAAKAALRPADEIMRIDGKVVATLPEPAVAALLEGPAGTMVVLDIVSPMTGMRTVTLRRETIAQRSVDAEWVGPSIARLTITSFQDSTLKEVDDALARLSEAGMKALILDLRGNGGGLFDSAVEVARRFLSDGVIATKQYLDDKSNIVTVVCEAKNPAALTLPIVLLIDGDTASAAEVVAGALKENSRATVVGQPTFGKGCTQFLVKLPDFKGGLPAGGMRLTVAKVFSPKGLPYTGRGIVPDVPVEREAAPSLGTIDAQLAAAHLEAQRLIGLTPR